MSSWARPGAKVLCVMGGDVAPGQGHRPKFGFPVKGKVYTLASSPFVSRFWGISHVHLVELPNPWKGDPSEDGGWALTRFRPLVTKTQQEDVELFRHLLTSTEERV